MLINVSGSFDPQIFLTVDSYTMDGCLEHSYHLVCYQESGEPAMADRNTVAVRSSRLLVVNLTFTSGGVDVCTHVDHHCINGLFVC